MGALQPTSALPPQPDQSGQAGVLSAGGGPPPMTPGNAPAQPPQPPPAPTHAHTVAALRHFHALGAQLESALKDPDLGKADIKSKVIEGMTQLVAQRIISAPQAVTQLATFPEKPFDQKKWLIDHYMHVKQAEMAVLDHHGAAFAGAGPQPAPSADDHMGDVAGMMQGHYGAQRA